MGGADPPTSLSQAVFPPPQKRGCKDKATDMAKDNKANKPDIPLGAMGTTPQGADPEGQPFWGCFRSNPPQDGPPNLGVARILLGSIPCKIVTDSYRFVRTFLGDLFLVNSRVSIHS